MACAATALSMSAQQSVVKDAEKAMKSGKPYTEVYQMILPAMSNPETEKEAATYYIPGKAGFTQYDNLIAPQQFGRLKEGEDMVMAVALLGGYDNFVKALPLDSVTDAKGKVKTKYSKDIVNQIAGHYNDFTAIGVTFYNAKDYKNAYRAWNTFVELSENADRFGIKAANDSTVANFLLNSGLAAWQDGDNALATRSFMKAAKKGYDKETAWQYGLATAIQANDEEALQYFATTGNERYGAEDTQYINSLINYYLKAEKYDDAIRYLDAAIAQNPSNGQYYALEGIIYESKNDDAKAMDLYKKAVELDPTNGLANYYYGRALSIEAGKMADAAPEAEINQIYREQLKPRYDEAIKVLEIAYENDKNNRSNTLNLLEQLYYVTNNEEGMESVKQRRLDD